MALTEWLRTVALAMALTLTPATVAAKGDLESKVEQVESAKPSKVKEIRPAKPLPLEKIDLPEEKKVQYTTKWWEYMLYIPLAYMVTLTSHEAGHAIAAKAYGYKDIKMKFFTFKEGNVAYSQMKYPYLNYKPSRLEEIIISGAGIGTTSLVNVGLTTMLRNNAVPERMRPFVATLSLMMMFDRYYYVASSTAKYAFGKSSNSNDIHSIITTLNGSKRGIATGYAVWFGLTALEIGLRYPEIKYLVHTAIGRKETLEKRYIQVHAYPIQSGGMFGVSGEF